jgi:hypothetical protein|tara:strand:- start:1603 stop:1803 length:201 start_codon:yes stop_codon:yes gene_type:complete
MRDLNFLCTGRNNVRDEDLLAIENIYPDVGAVMQEMQFLRDQNEELFDENDTLRKEVEDDALRGEE